MNHEGPSRTKGLRGSWAAGRGLNACKLRSLRDRFRAFLASDPDEAGTASPVCALELVYKADSFCAHEQTAQVRALAFFRRLKATHRGERKPVDSCQNAGREPQVANRKLRFASRPPQAANPESHSTVRRPSASEPIWESLAACSRLTPSASTRARGSTSRVRRQAERGRCWRT